MTHQMAFLVQYETDLGTRVRRVLIAPDYALARLRALDQEPEIVRDFNITVLNATAPSIKEIALC